MNDNLVHYLIEVGSGLSTAALLGIVGFYQGMRKERRRVSKAPFVFVNRLDELINRAIHEGPEMVLVNARAIVSARNSLAGSLASISSQLNGEINRLAVQIRQQGFEGGILYTPEVSANESPTSPNDVYSTIQVLARIWPAKRSEIIFAVRKLMVELGLPFDSSDEASFENPAYGEGRR